MSPARRPDPGDDGPAPDDSVAYFVSHQAEIEGRQLTWARKIVPAIAIVVLLGGTLWMAFAAVNSFSAAGQSMRTQKHGVPATGVVTSVANSNHSYVDAGTRWSQPVKTTWYRASINVDLVEPVRGHSATTAYAPVASTLRVGAQVKVLVDPQHPEYAELPGQPLESEHAWILIPVFAGLFALADVYVAVKIARIAARRRSAPVRDN